MSLRSSILVVIEKSADVFNVFFVQLVDLFQVFKDLDGIIFTNVLYHIILIVIIIIHIDPTDMHDDVVDTTLQSQFSTMISTAKKPAKKIAAKKA
jgi:hypothetical protein